MLQFYMTVELTYMTIDMYGDVFKYFNEVPPSNIWFPYEHIDYDVNKKLEKTKGRITGDEMEKETKHSVEYPNHHPNWLKTITIEIDRFIIDTGYINFFVQMYM